MKIGKNALTLSLIASLLVTTFAIGRVFAQVTTLAAPDVMDKTLKRGSSFSINITVADVSEMWGYEFVLSYDTRILTATSYSSHDPFTLAWPSEINDAEGYVAIAFSMPMMEPFGFDTVEPAPIARIDFEVDRRGSTMLDLHDTMLSDIYGEMIPHNVVDGFFANINIEIPDIAVTSVTPPEPPSDSSPEIYSIPYLAMESQSFPRWYAAVDLTETYSATGISGNSHVYKNYISSSFDWVAFHIVLGRKNATHYEWLEAGLDQNQSGFYLYAASGFMKLGEWPPIEYDKVSYSTVPLTDHSLEIVETTTETFEARIDSSLVKTYTFSYIFGDRRCSAEGESINPTNSLRGHFWNLKYYDSEGVSHPWTEVEPYQDPPYAVGFSDTDDFYTRGGGVLGDVNGDGIVNINDAGQISAHWYDYFWDPIGEQFIYVTGPLGYDENADIYPLWPDGYVELQDATQVHVQWHQTAG